MVIVEQLRISDDGKSMFINAHVNTASPYNNIGIESITIMTASQVAEGSDPNCASDSNYVKKVTFTNELDNLTKEVSLVFYPSDFDVSFTKSTFSEDLFFVYFEATAVGEQDPCLAYLPCELQSTTNVAVVFDENLLYQRVMDYTKGLASNCSVSQGFIDFILLWNAFKASVETEHFIPAIKFYNMLFGNATDSESTNGSHSPYGGGSTVITSNCGCSNNAGNSISSSR